MSKSTARKTIVFTRYSDENQRQESCADQERVCRKHLKREGIPTGNLLVFREEALSGMKDDRPQYQKLKGMIDAKQVAIVVVDDQSRLSRGMSVKMLVQDLVASGGRFLSVGEGIDTRRDGWEEMVGFNELKHSLSSRDTSRRIRRGQEGRILDENGSMGDFPYGYRSVWAEPNWQQILESGKRPKKKVCIDEQQAEVVRWIFRAYALEGWSICGIARDLNRRNVPKGQRARSAKWRHQTVRRMLNQEKYIGQWAWGRLESVRDSKGKVYQRPASRQEPVVVKRPTLRIIDQELWQKAQQRRRKNREKHRIGNAPVHPKHEFPVHNLGGLIRCGHCGTILSSIVQPPWGRYLYCGKYYDGICCMNRRATVEQIENALYGFMNEICSSWPEWLTSVKRSLVDKVKEATQVSPGEVAAAESELAAVRKKINNLVRQMEDGGIEIGAIKGRLLELQEAEGELKQRIADLRRLMGCPTVLPDDDWIQQQLKNLPSLLATPTPVATQLLKQLFSKVELFKSNRPCLKKPIIRMRVQLRSSELLFAAMGDDWKDKLRLWLPETDADSAPSPTFEFDVTDLSLTEKRGPELNRLREEGHSWPKIAEQLGLSLGQAKLTYYRWRKWNGLTQPRTPLWEQHGERVHELLQQGTHWDEIAKRLGLTRHSCIGLHQRWKRAHGITGGFSHPWEQLGPVIHQMHRETLTMPQIAEKLGKSVSAIRSNYDIWRKRTGTTEPRLTLAERWGPKISGMRKQGLPWNDVADELEMTKQQAFDLHRHWLKRSK